MGLLQVMEYLSSITFEKRYEIEREIKRRLKSDDFPPFYPNGWLPILESSALKSGQIKPIFACGNELVAFRGASGNVTVMDAYCPHLGANLGYGGDITGDSIKCPFHGWVFNNNGACTQVPDIETQNLPKVQLKVWKSIEVNGLIFVWNHSKGENPNWFIPKDKQLDENGLHWGGKSEYNAFCHIQEITENAADLTHMNVLHKPMTLSGGPIHKLPFYNVILKYAYWKWTGDWNACEAPNDHMAQLQMENNFFIFGFKIISLSIKTKLIGAAHAWVDIHSKRPFDMKFHIVLATISRGPLSHTIYHNLYTNYPSIIGRLITSCLKYGIRKMFEKDIEMWNHKKYLPEPHFDKNEASIKKFRRWFTQFYSTD